MKFTSTLPIFILLSLLFASCSDKNDEPETSIINSVFAFQCSDKSVSISNHGLNAVINVSALTHEYELPIVGSFIHCEIDCESSWLKAKVEDKKLKLSFSLNYVDQIRSANISIKANDSEQIVTANVAVNQACMTDAEKLELETHDIEFVIEVSGGTKPLPSNSDFETNVWYPLSPDGDAYFRIVYRQEEMIPIKTGDTVYPNYGICTIENAIYGSNNWWLNTIADNHHSNLPVTVSNNPTAQQISEFGLGMLLPLTKGICFGDDIDLLLSSKMGLPSLEQDKCAYIYVVQYNSKPINSASKANIRHFNGSSIIRQHGISKPKDRAKLLP